MNANEYEVSHNTQKKPKRMVDNTSVSSNELSPQSHSNIGAQDASSHQQSTVSLYGIVN